MTLPRSNYPLFNYEVPRSNQRIATGILKNFGGVIIFYSLLGAIRLWEQCLLIKEQISRVSRWCVLKNYKSSWFLSRCIKVGGVLHSVAC